MPWRYNMIYVFSVNNYFTQGVLEYLHPIKCQTHHYVHTNKTPKIENGCIFILDSSYIHLADLLLEISKSIFFYCIFIDDSKKNTLPPACFFPNTIRLSMHTSPENLRLLIVDILFKKSRLNLQKKPKLTSKEAVILHASLKGFSARDISSSYNMNVTSVYFHRRKICMKFGVKKICNIISTQDGYYLMRHHNNLK